MDNFMNLLTNKDFHAVNFDYKGRHYCFAGWWVLDWDEDSKDYDTLEEFIKDPFFDGKTISELSGDIENPDFEFFAGYKI